MKSAYFYSEAFALYQLSPDHPYEPIRAKRAYEIMNKYHLLNHPSMEVIEHKPLDRDKIITAHDPRFIEALEKANGGLFELYMLEYGLGSEDCPVFPGCYDMAALAAGGTFEAVELVDSGKFDFAFNPMGGYHHAGWNRAEGFCYLDDINIAITHLLSKGRKVAYVDIDAHHGNGVQDLFYTDNRVMKISVHESGKYLYPGGGFETEIGEGQGRGFTVNIPLEPMSDDEVFFYCFNEIVPPLLQAFEPDFIIGNLGMDMMGSDPLTHLNLTNNGYADACAIINHIAPRWVGLGAGGYDMNNVARGWALAWAVIHKLETGDDAMSLLGGTFLGGGEMGVASLRDMHTYTTGPAKEKAYREADRIVEYIKNAVFPIHGAEG